MGLGYTPPSPEREKLEEKGEESGEKRSCLPPSSTCLYREGLHLKEAIALVGNNSWREIGSYLGFREYQLSDIPLEYNKQSTKLMYIIEKWCAEKGRMATLGTLLEACEGANVSRNDIEMEYSERMT